MLNDKETCISELLKAAHSRRELPIKQLAVFDEFSSLLSVAMERLSHFNVFIASFDNILDEYIAFAQKIRKLKDSIFIVFAVDKSVDISSCVRPSVRPSGILFIPLEQKRIYQNIREIYAEYLRMSSRDEQPLFSIKSGGEYFSVDTGDILFFEAQGKKIAVKTKGQEISFYSNFDAVLEQLPNWFVRCHKGYVVNLKQATGANFTDMTLTLRDRSIIPVSRTYKDDVRALLAPKGGS